jgi:hypothetical protein
MICKRIENCLPRNFNDKAISLLNVSYTGVKIDALGLKWSTWNKMNLARVCNAIVICLAAAPLAHAGLCPRPASGGAIAPPAEVRSINGRLQIALAFTSQVDDYGLTRYCYIDENGNEAPALRVKTGDEVVLALKNQLTPGAKVMPEHGHAANACSAGPMTALSTNLHFHGLEIPPSCHQDEVIHTSIQPSEPAFQYRFKIPADSLLDCTGIIRIRMATARVRCWAARQAR